MRNLIFEATQTESEKRIAELEKERDEKIKDASGSEKEGIKKIYKQKIDTIKLRDQIEKAEENQKKLKDEYDKALEEAGDNKSKIAKVKEKYGDKIDKAQNKVDDLKDQIRNVRGLIAGKNVILHKNDKLVDNDKGNNKEKGKSNERFAKYASGFGDDSDEDDIKPFLKDKDINKNDVDEDDVNRFYEQAKKHDSMAKCMENMPWGVIGLAAVFCPPLALGLGGAILLPGIINTVMTGLGALKDIKDEVADKCSVLANGVKTAIAKIKSNNPEDQMLDDELDEVMNASFTKDGELNSPKDIEAKLNKSESGKLILKDSNILKDISDKKIDEKVAAAEIEKNSIEKEKQHALDKAKSEDEKKEIETKFQEKLDDANEKIEAAKNGETISKEEVEDDSGKKVKVAVHTGPRGGRYYYAKGHPHTDENKRYLTKESKSFEDYLNMVMESENKTK